MAGRYRALLIGNSTYPADEHNLQTLRGPVKDIAALNRALVDPNTGLFADVDVALLAEATSAGAIRSLGRFFGTAGRDDVLLLYFSGHGKLDQSGRLHLCMHDTESTDLLSTALSSTRINEFADASRAGNVVIVLDCCYAGAFRGGDLGDTVAGPGRYVLTSCRGTQLANDATVENGTSFFTQHLVDGLLTAAVDQDGDGYVGFSDLYAYVDRRLRAAGKQIPQRRVSGDGDLRLAKAPRGRPVVVDARDPPQPPTPVEAPASGGGDPSTNQRPPRARRRIVISAVAAVVLAAAGATIAGELASSGGSDGNMTQPGSGANSYTTDKPWRLRIQDTTQGASEGCTITMTETHSGASVPLRSGVYAPWTQQIHETGSFRWQSNSPTCVVTPLAGSGSTTLPFSRDEEGDSDAFPAPRRVTVRATTFHDRGTSECPVRLYDPSDGQVVDGATAKPNADTVVLDTGGRRTVYLGASLQCAFRVSVAR